MDIDLVAWIGTIASVLTLLGVAWGGAAWLRANRKVTIVVTCNGNEKLIATLPARLITRGEINGLVSQKAGPARLDLSNFQFDYYKVNKKVSVPLSQTDFDLVK